MDVKVGDGAFMPSHESSHALAESIATVATGAGTPTTALLTDMNQCLADSAGNAVEVAEAVTFLTTSRRNPRLAEVTLALAAEVLQTGGLAGSSSAADKMLHDALDSGRAADAFGRMVHSLGGPPDFLEHHAVHLDRDGLVERAVHAARDGVVTAVATRELGLCVVRLGGGRTRADQAVDHAVGLTRVAGLGSPVADTPLAIVHARSEQDADQAEAAVRAAFTIGDESPAETPVVYERVSDTD